MDKGNNCRNVRGSQGRVVAYPQGHIMIAPGIVQKGVGKVGGKRGAIKGWSLASRARMRRFLVQWQPPADWRTYNVTLTLPSLGKITAESADWVPPPDPHVRWVKTFEGGKGIDQRIYKPEWERQVCDADEKRIFAAFSDRAAKAGWCAVWRLEVQQRGARHWHCIVSLPPDTTPDSGWVAGVGGLPSTPAALRSRALSRGSWDVKELWHECLDSIGERTWQSTAMNKWGQLGLQEYRAKLASFSGASEHSALAMWEGQIYWDDKAKQVKRHGNSWFRYMADHATKGKQAQVAEGKGRQWGIIGRKHFEAAPCGTADLSVKQYAAVMRWHNRLATGSCFDPDSPFGRKLGKLLRRGRRGQTVLFSRPDTVRRMVAWAQAQIDS